MKTYKFKIENRNNINWVKEGLKFIENYFSTYDINKFAPFFHGTTNFHWEHIKRDCAMHPRGKRLSVWAHHSNKSDLSSMAGRIYFASFYSTMPSHASLRAWEQTDTILKIEQKVRNDEMTKKEYEDLTGFDFIDFKREIKPIILRLMNINPYMDYLEPDEDDSFVHDLKRTFYFTPETERPDSFLPVKTEDTIDQPIIALFDVAWLYHGSDAVLELGKAIPPIITSLYSAKSIAISSVISNCDLLPMNIDQYNKLKDKIRSDATRLEKSGITLEDRDIKQSYIEAVEKMHFIPKRRKWKGEKVPDELLERLKLDAEQKRIIFHDYIENVKKPYLVREMKLAEQRARKHKLSEYERREKLEKLSKRLIQ